jgi:cytochrome c5
MVLAGLVVFAIVIMGVAWILHGQLETPYNPARTQAKLDRLAPVAGVYAGETGRAAALAAAKAAAPEAMAVAFDGSLDGAMIYDSVCATCHANGVAGTEMLIDNAINGIGAMPARGGRADLSDEQVAASVTHMLDMLE